MSKFSLNVLNQCMYPFTEAYDSDVILGAVFGEDVALTRVGHARYNWGMDARIALYSRARQAGIKKDATHMNIISDWREQ